MAEVASYLVIPTDKKHRMRSEEMAHSVNCHTKHEDLNSIPKTDVLKRQNMTVCTCNPIMIQG